MHKKVTIGNAELWHGDCRDVLPELRADACVTDPPYGVELGTTKGSGGAVCRPLDPLVSRGLLEGLCLTKTDG